MPRVSLGILAACRVTEQRRRWDLFAHFEARCRLLRFPPLRHEPFARCRFPSGTFTQTKYRQVPHTGCY